MHIVDDGEEVAIENWWLILLINARITKNAESKCLWGESGEVDGLESHGDDDGYKEIVDTFFQKVDSFSTGFLEIPDCFFHLLLYWYQQSQL